ncbi:hypothetical protein CCU22_00635 [Candidatus Legionella polyplacis]|nr:DUF2065 domain-containing protein [Candidatus Legionella polyplacis]ATW01735.1 hypothetical protein CCU22_00635 [Candidatus Legionella polyplacis]
MIDSFFSALALVFVLEGLMLFIFSEKWKRSLQKIINQEEKTLKIVGFISMLIGVFLLTIIHQLFE